MSVQKRWRRSPISPLAHATRMDSIRQANIYPTCRLDKSSRAVYEPEDVWAKRAALVKPESRPGTSNSWARDLFKQKVLTISTTGVTKDNMNLIDRVKETVAVLMKSKERAADIGKAERRIFQPQVARKMAQMDAARKAEFEKGVQQEVERVVYEAKRRYVRRQEQLDETGVFHPEANAHRVHTQFWADLNNKVDITKIENKVWMKMCADAKQSRNATAASVPSMSSVVHRRSRPMATGASRAMAANDSESGRPSSKESSRHEVVSHPKQKAADDEIAKDDAPAAIDGTTAAPPSAKFFDILGYDELGHVPTLDEFRSEWAKLRTKSEQALLNGLEENAAGSSWKSFRRKPQTQGGGQAQQQGAGSVVNELSKKDEVFRHFKKYYDKVDHSAGRAGDALFSAGVASTGLLQPDFDVIETVGRHTAQKQETRVRNRIGRGLLSAPGVSAGASGRSSSSSKDRRRSSEATPGNVDRDDRIAKQLPGDGSDGFTNVFRDTMLRGNDIHRGVHHKHCEGNANLSLPHSRNDVSRVTTDSRGGPSESLDTGNKSNGSLTNKSGPNRGGGRARGQNSPKFKGGADSGRAKASTEGSSASAELQARLETAWRALFVPARMKLDFLQKYSTVERILELPKTVHLLEIASKAVPLREKVIDHLRRIEEDGESMSASVISDNEKFVLSSLGCWEKVSTAPESVVGRGPVSGNYDDDDGDDVYHDNRDAKQPGGSDGDSGNKGRSRGASDGDTTNENGVEEEVAQNNAEKGSDEGSAEEAKRQAHQRSSLEREMRRKEAEALLAWLKSIESHLAERCAEVCDAAWYDLGETITYKGRPVAYGLPEAVVEAAIKRREDREDSERRFR